MGPVGLMMGGVSVGVLFLCSSSALTLLIHFSAVYCHVKSTIILIVVSAFSGFVWRINFPTSDGISPRSQSSGARAHSCVVLLDVVIHGGMISWMSSSIV